MRPKKTILLVDDDQVALSVRRFLFETWGFRVVTATTGAEALQRLEASGSGEVYLMVCEMDMEMRGGELARRAKHLHPKMSVLAVSRRFVYQPDFADAAWDAFLPLAAGSAELLERARLLTARKRGPKK